MQHLKGKLLSFIGSLPYQNIANFHELELISYYHTVRAFDHGAATAYSESSAIWLTINSEQTVVENNRSE